MSEVAATGMRRGEMTPDLYFGDAMHHAGIGMAIATADGHLVEVNAALCDFLERSTDQLVGLAWQEFTHPDDRGVGGAELAELLAGERHSFRTRRRYLTPHGGEVWGDVTVTAVRTRDGELRYLIAQIVDVTIEVKATEALAESERSLRAQIASEAAARKTADEAAERFRLAMHNAEVGMCLVAPCGDLLEVNASLCSFFGRSADDLTQRTWQELTHPDDLALDEALVADVLAGRRRAYRLRKRYRDPDGRTLWGDLQVSAVRDADDAVQYFISQIIDVTHAVEATASLAASEAMLQALLENSPDATIAFDRDLRVRFANRAMCDATDGYAADWTGLPIEALGMRPSRAGLHRYHLMRVLESGTPRSYSFIGNGFGDNAQVYEAVAAPITAPDGTVSGVVETLRDVTDRVRAEAANAEKQALITTMFDSAPDAMLLFGADLRVQAANARVAQMTGIPLDAWPGRRLGDIRGHAARAAEHEAHLREALETRAPVRYEFSRVAPDGSDVVFDAQVVPVTGSDGQINQLALVFHDVTDRVRTEARALEAERHFRMVAERSANIVFTTDLAGRVTWVSPSVTHVTGWQPDEVIGQRFAAERMHPDDLRTFGQTPVQDPDAGAPLRVEFRIRCTDGSYRWMSAEGRPIVDADGTITGRVTNWRDVDAQRRAHDAAAASEAKVHAVLDASLDGVMHVGRDLTLQYVNPHAVAYSGEGCEAWIGRHVGELIAARSDAAAHVDRLRAVMNSGEPLTFDYSVAVDGDERWFEAQLAPVTGPNGTTSGVIETSRDVTDRVRAERRALLLATQDPLTGLPNRLAARDELARALAADRRSGGLSATLMLDLDRFKFVNDSLGHDAGDDLLCLAARRITAAVREQDLVARLGGDEFVVVMRDLDARSDAYEVAERLAAALRAPYTVDGNEVRLATSVGVAFSSAGSTPGDLLRDADTAMYAAKAAGGDRHATFDDGMRAAAIEQMQLAGDLRAALDADSFTTWFQPEVDLSTGDIRAAEALVRWHRPDGTVWPAARFLDVAEATGLIIPIGTRVLRDACRAAAGWPVPGGGSPVRLRVNLSEAQLRDDKLLSHVDSALAESGLAGDRLWVELTDAAIVRATGAAAANLAGLRDRGIGIVSDDFGTGAGALAHLRGRPVDVVKIDRSLVAALVDGERNRRLLADTIVLLLSMGLEVTAEGVETAEQAAALAALGCPTAQGFHLGAVIDGAHISDLLAGQRAT